MEDSNYQWSILFRKYRYKTITEEELKELESLSNADPIKMQQFKQWTNRQEFNKQLRYYRGIKTDDAWKNLVAAHPSVVTPAQTPHKKKATIYKIGKVAAAVGIIAIICSIMYVLSEKEDELSPVVKTYNYVQQVSGAEYQLGSGTSNALFALQRPELNDQDSILKVTAAPGGSVKSNALFDLVTAPHKQMKVEFADGSRVTLFPATGLRFPLAFKTTEREVQMSGQAYFQVTSNEKVPFRVHLKNGVKVEARGTAFNIASFENGKIILTLITGTVTMYYKDKKIDVKPGEQIEFTLENKFKRLSSFDYKQAIAWTHNRFDFKNKDVKDVIMEIGRYYHYDVIFKDPLPIKYVGGVFNMNDKLENILTAISAGTDLNIKLEGNTIIVSRAA